MVLINIVVILSILIAGSFEIWVFLKGIFGFHGLWDSAFTKAYPVWIFFIVLPYASSIALLIFSHAKKESLGKTLLVSASLVTLGGIGWWIAVTGIREPSHSGFEELFFGMLIQYGVVATAWNGYAGKIRRFILMMFLCFLICGFMTDSGFNAWACLPVILVLSAISYLWEKSVRDKFSRLFRNP